MMKCTQVERLVSRWQDGHQPTAEEARELEGHLAECETCRTGYRTLSPLVLRDAGAGGWTARPDLPLQLEDRIMDRVRRLPVPRSAPRFQLRWASGAAFAAILLAAIGLGGGLALRARSVAAYLTVTFVLDTPDARSVAIAGDFTGWQTAGYELARRPTDGAWAITVRLRRDRSYAYCFVVDGERWMPDPAAPETVEDGFGGVNSILRL